MVKYNAVIKNIIAFLLITVCAFAYGVPLSAENSNNPVSDTAKAAAVQGSTAAEYSYADYCKEYSGADAAEEAITVSVNKSLTDSPVTLSVSVPAAALYTVGISYIPTDDGIGDIEAGVKINGKYPFDEAKKLYFPRFWKDEAENRKDGLGNEFAAKQVPFGEYCFSNALDVTKRTDSKYTVYLNAGINTVELIPVSGKIKLEYIEFGVEETVDFYKAPASNGKMYGGKPIIIEGEKPYLKNSYWLSAKNDNMSAGITPRSSVKSLVNYIGGSNWKNAGEAIIWETPELEEGYYKLGFSFRQNTVIGGKVYRKLTIDGKVPFAEGNAIGFGYDDNWQSSFAENDGEPFYIYLTAGKHKIGLTAVPGQMSEVYEKIQSALSEIGSLYIDITMIVGETVDTYRDYDLFSQIPDMEEQLNTIHAALKDADEDLVRITGQKSGSNSSVIKNMMRVTEQMLDNRFTAHRYKSEYYNRYTSLAAVLYDLRNMPLDIDKLVLAAPDEKNAFEKTGLLGNLRFSVEKFIYSFITDYNNISSADGDTQGITIWVNWGRDQAQVLNSLTQTSFTKETGIPVNIKLVNASVIQAVLSGKGPDCILQHSRTEPVNLAMRGVLYDLTQFDDLNEVLKRFQSGADTPYRYKNGLYALPDTQTFFLMFYRKDILEQLGISVPETWEQFKETAKLLARSNLKVWIPNNIATSLEQTSGGVGTINIFPSLLLQQGLNIYSENGRATNLTDNEVMLTFGEWTDMYRKLKIPTTMDFYNRFRTGTCPIGINSYVLYTTLKAAAPEIEGLWGVAPIPGTVNESGEVSHISAGGGTACAILKSTKSPENSWEFLKWWTSASTQLAFSNEVEAVLGPTGRVAVSNVETFGNMEWDSDMLGSVLSAWSQVKEVPEYPGSYYLSRSVYQSFWNVVENNMNPKDMLIRYGKQADAEMERKWRQYENR